MLRGTTNITEPLSGKTPPQANQGTLGADFAARRSAPFFDFDPEGFPDPEYDAASRSSHMLRFNSPASVQPFHAGEVA